MTNSAQSASQLAASVVKRLIAKLDEAHQPTVGIEQDGRRVELRDWLTLVCFSDDHELHDDILAVLARGRLTHEEALRSSQAAGRLEASQPPCTHDLEYLERQPGETYTGYCEQCTRCGKIVQIPQ